MSAAVVSSASTISSSPKTSRKTPRARHATDIAIFLPASDSMNSRDRALARQVVLPVVVPSSRPDLPEAERSKSVAHERVLRRRHVRAADLVAADAPPARSAERAASISCSTVRPITRQLISQVSMSSDVAVADGDQHARRGRGRRSGRAAGASRCTQSGVVPRSARRCGPAVAPRGQVELVRLADELHDPRQVDARRTARRRALHLEARGRNSSSDAADASQLHGRAPAPGTARCARASSAVNDADSNEQVLRERPDVAGRVGRQRDHVDLGQSWRMASRSAGLSSTNTSESRPMSSVSAIARSWSGLSSQLATKTAMSSSRRRISGCRSNGSRASASLFFEQTARIDAARLQLEQVLLERDDTPRPRAVPPSRMPPRPSSPIDAAPERVVEVEHEALPAQAEVGGDDGGRVPGQQRQRLERHRLLGEVPVAVVEPAASRTPRRGGRSRRCSRPVAGRLARARSSGAGRASRAPRGASWQGGRAGFAAGARSCAGRFAPKSSSERDPRARPSGPPPRRVRRPANG